MPWSPRRRVGADAIHPGFGFLAENPAFARRWRPRAWSSSARPPDVSSGSATRRPPSARPRPPGSRRARQQDARARSRPRSTAQSARCATGVAEGGGRRRRQGHARRSRLDGLAREIESAMREAENSFGNAGLIVESYRPRAPHRGPDRRRRPGQAIHLFERECTLQRRHQKVIEEAPAAGLPRRAARRDRADACRLAKRLSYRGLGTVEFILAGGIIFSRSIRACRSSTRSPRRSPGSTWSS